VINAVLGLVWYSNRKQEPPESQILRDFVSFFCCDDVMGRISTEPFRTTKRFSSPFPHFKTTEVARGCVSLPIYPFDGMRDENGGVASHQLAMTTAIVAVYQSCVSTQLVSDGKQFGSLTQENALEVIQFVLALPECDFRQLFLEHIITERGELRALKFTPSKWISSNNLITVLQNEENSDDNDNNDDDNDDGNDERDDQGNADNDGNEDGNDGNDDGLDGAHNDDEHQISAALMSLSQGRSSSTRVHSAQAPPPLMAVEVMPMPISNDSGRFSFGGKTPRKHLLLSQKSSAASMTSVPRSALPPREYPFISFPIEMISRRSSDTGFEYHVILSTYCHVWLSVDEIASRYGYLTALPSEKTSKNLLHPESFMAQLIDQCDQLNNYEHEIHKIVGRSTSDPNLYVVQWKGYYNDMFANFRQRFLLDDSRMTNCLSRLSVSSVIHFFRT
jgi:hypothetical protein